MEASVDGFLQLVLTSRDGRAIQASGDGLDDVLDTTFGQLDQLQRGFLGRVNFVRFDARDIKLVGNGFEDALKDGMNRVVSLRDLRGAISGDMATAMGFTTMIAPLDDSQPQEC